jgi:Cu-Zn family superoxide dismutase
MRSLLVLFALAPLAGCAVPHPGPPTAVGQLVRADHVPIGEVQVLDDQSGSRIHIEASGLPPGVHGVHLHAVGRCDGADFAAAGPHWNPTHRLHGHDNRAGYHKGDLGNVMVGADGAIDTELIATDVRLLAAPGTRGLSISDKDGTSLIIHALQDDERTDPSGNSGERIACAVVAQPQGG